MHYSYITCHLFIYLLIIARILGLVATGIRLSHEGWSNGPECAQLTPRLNGKWLAKGHEALSRTPIRSSDFILCGLVKEIFLIRILILLGITKNRSCNLNYFNITRAIWNVFYAHNMFLFKIYLIFLFWNENIKFKCM